MMKFRNHHHTMRNLLLSLTIVCWMLLVQASTAAGDSVQDDPLIQNLISWIRDNGGDVDERQELRMVDPDRPEKGVGVYAKEFIPSGAVLVSLPWETIIAPQQPHTTDVCETIHVLQRKLRLLEKQGPTSKYAPHVQVLRKYGKKPLLTWSEEGQELLENILGEHIPPLDIGQPLKWWEEECGGDSETDSLGLEALYLMVGDPSPNVMTSWERFQAAVIPYYGLYNHRDGAERTNADVTRPKVGEKVDVFSLKNIHEGEQIYISYGMGNPSPISNILRNQAVVPDLPRHFHFHWRDYGDMIDLSYDVEEIDSKTEDEDGDDEDAETEQIHWANGHPPEPRAIELLQKELDRLYCLVKSMDLNATFLHVVPQHERNLIRDYLLALYDGMELATVTPLERQVTPFTITDFPVAGVNLGDYEFEWDEEYEWEEDDSQNSSEEPFLLFDDFNLEDRIRGDESWDELIKYRQKQRTTSLSFYLDKVARKRWLPTIGIDQPTPIALRYGHELDGSTDKVEEILQLIPNGTDYVAKPSHQSETTGIWLVAFDAETNKTTYNSDGRLIKQGSETTYDPRVVADSLSKNLNSKPRYYESRALKKVYPGIVIEERFVELDRSDRPPIEFGVFTIWGRVWMAKMNYVEEGHRDRVSGGFIFRDGTFAEGSLHEEMPFDWLDWSHIVEIAETLGAHKDFFRTDIFVGLPAAHESATKEERLAAVRYVVSECEIYPTTVFPTDRITEEAARLWVAGYRGNYKVGSNTEVPKEFLEKGWLGEQ